MTEQPPAEGHDSEPTRGPGGGPRPADRVMPPEATSAAGMPRWVMVFGVIAVLVVLLVVVMLLAGHGPGRHLGHTFGSLHTTGAVGTTR